ncbi:MAG: zinc-binding dehydrogenase [Burkholderiales bacterium]|nr:zinc-binding dehydrogenase [Burkholderiales bacterium]
MQSYWIDGGTGALQLREVPKPVPAAGEILIRLKAAGLNRGEFILGHGLHKPGGVKPAGFEGSGEVVAVGPGVTEYKIGDAVMGRTTAGFAEFSTLALAETLRKPEALTWEEAAGASLTYWVAYDMVVTEGRIGPGDWVLVSAVSSGVGVASMQIAKALGAKVIGTSGSKTKLERLKSLGLDVGVAVRGPGFLSAVMDATGGAGVRLAINNVGASVFPELVASLAYRGAVGIVGYVDGSFNATIDLNAVHVKRLRVFGVSNKVRPLAERGETVAGFARDVLPLIARGVFKPPIDRVFDFTDLPAARAYMESDAQVGKIVVRMPA